MIEDLERSNKSWGEANVLKAPKKVTLRTLPPDSSEIRGLSHDVVTATHEYGQGRAKERVPPASLCAPVPDWLKKMEEARVEQRKQKKRRKPSSVWPLSFPRMSQDNRPCITSIWLCASVARLPHGCAN